MFGCVAQRQPLATPTNVAPLPQNYQEVVERQAREKLIDPESGRFRFSGEPRPCAVRYANTTPAYKRGIVGVERSGYCGVVFVNAKNRMGGYTGEVPTLYVLDGAYLAVFDDIAMFEYDRKPWE